MRKAARGKSNFIKKIKPYVYVFPAVFMFVFFVLYPAISGVFYSFTKWDGINKPQFIGLKNYIEAISGNPTMWVALKNSLIYIIFFSAIPIILGLIIATLLSRFKIKGMTFFRTAFFLPQVIPLVAIGVIWRWIYNPSFGVINNLLETAGLSNLGRAWLGDQNIAIFAIGFIGVWAGYGFCMVIFLSGMQKIDEFLYEAAMLDGANEFQQFFYVTLPQLTYEITVTLVVTMVSAIKIFDIIYVTTKGGPGIDTMSISLYIFKNAFELNNKGYASSIAVILTLLVFIIVISIIKLRERRQI